MKASMKALALLAGCSLAGSAFAQCTNDTTINPQPTPVNFAGNTCGKNLGLTTICGGADPTNGAGTSVIQINFGQNPTPTFTVVSSTAGFNPELAFTTGSCSSLSGCTVDATNNTQTVGPVSPVPNPANGATGFVFVSDLNPESPGCGDYNLTITGTIPVKLQDFSVQ